MHWTNDIILNVERLCPSGTFDAAALLAERPQRPFAEEGLALVADFSAEVLADPAARRWPEMAALGFWMRRANIARIQAAFEAACGGRLLVGRGLAFHIAPSNVDTMFIYSLFVSLLAGNTNIVRVSPKLRQELASALELLARVLQRHTGAARRLLVVRYGHDDKVTAFFSGLCNVRVIWGGDETVRRIRAIPLPPHALELAFAGKFSVAVLDAGAWNAEPDQRGRQGLRQRRLCLPPAGLRIAQAGLLAGIARGSGAGPRTFWEAVQQAAAEMPSYTLQPADVMNRFVAVCSMAADAEAAVGKAEAANHAFTRVAVSRLDDVVREANTGNGLFYEVADAGLDALLAWFGDSDQTVASYGVSKEEWEGCLSRRPPNGICRIVRLGKALDFSAVWDGYDLVRCLSREITLEV